MLRYIAQIYLDTELVKWLSGIGSIMPRRSRRQRLDFSRRSFIAVTFRRRISNRIRLGLCFIVGYFATMMMSDRSRHSPPGATSVTHLIIDPSLFVNEHFLYSSAGAAFKTGSSHDLLCMFLPHWLDVWYCLCACLCRCLGTRRLVQFPSSRYVFQSDNDLTDHRQFRG